MKDCMATEIMMDSDTDTKTLWGEDPDKKNRSASNCLNYSHFRVQSYLPCSSYIFCVCGQ